MAILSVDLKPYYEVLYVTDVWDRPTGIIDGIERFEELGRESEYDFCKISAPNLSD